MNEVVNAAPYLGIIAQIIMWFGLIIVLSMMKGWIVQGTSMAISDWILKHAEARERACRWLGDKGQILEILKKIDADGSGGSDR